MASASQHAANATSPAPLATTTQPSNSYSTQSSLTPPESNLSTPNDTSPSSPHSIWTAPPHLNLQAKQLRSPRSPLYVPAVLRPTEKPIKNSPPKGDRATALDSNLHELRNSELDQGNLATSGLRRLVTEEWNESTVIEITGPPSRNHWKPDPSSPKCDSSDCNRPFTLFTRRHHCRRCGNIFCAEHSPHTIPLDQHARFHPLAAQFRSCEDCFRDYKVWETDRKRRDNDASAARASSASGPSAGLDINAKKKSEPGGLINALAQSVPRDWNWSTF